jgi:hypothetical protein
MRAALLDAALFAAVVAVGVALVLVTAHASGYRVSIYTVAPCAPPTPVAPHAMSPNPFAAEANDAD